MNLRIAGEIDEEHHAGLVHYSDTNREPTGRHWPTCPCSLGQISPGVAGSEPKICFGPVFLNHSKSWPTMVFHQTTLQLERCFACVMFCWWFFNFCLKSFFYNPKVDTKKVSTMQMASKGNGLRTQQRTAAAKTKKWWRCETSVVTCNDVRGRHLTERCRKSTADKWLFVT